MSHIEGWLDIAGPNAPLYSAITLGLGFGLLQIRKHLHEAGVCTGTKPPKKTPPHGRVSSVANEPVEVRNP